VRAFWNQKSEAEQPLVIKDFRSRESSFVDIRGCRHEGKPFREEAYDLPLFSAIAEYLPHIRGFITLIIFQ
jgi:hypothetical protein